jgi:hypothetical protein
MAPMARQSWKLRAAPGAWRLWRAMVRLAPKAPVAAASGQAVIFACLHRDILPAIMYVRPWHPTLLVSGSPDGDILIRTLGRDHYGFVRGATGEDGKRAFVALRRELDAGRCIGVAVDGPKGPFGVINEGVLQLARLGGAPIVPLRVTAGRRLVLRTWDRTVVPLPFSRIVVEQGARLLVPRQAGEAELAVVRGHLECFFAEEGGQHAGS